MWTKAATLGCGRARVDTSSFAAYPSIMQTGMSRVARRCSVAIIAFGLQKRIRGANAPPWRYFRRPAPTSKPIHDHAAGSSSGKMQLRRTRRRRVPTRAAEPRGIGGWRLAVGSGRETADAMSSHPYPGGFPALKGRERCGASGNAVSQINGPTGQRIN
jgi:hypothetical protein